jgi:TRAP-type C4-dicarboxylate transport system permease small subunit
LKRVLEKFLERLLIVLMASLALLVVAGVAFRKFGAPLTWYDELAPILLAWLTYYGACLAALKRAHIGFPKLVAAAPPRLRLAMTIVREICVVVFFALAAWAGWKVMVVLGDSSMVSLEWLPARVTQSVIPISSVLFIIAELVAFTAWLQGEEDAVEAEE